MSIPSAVPIHGNAEPDMSWIEVAVTRGGVIVADYSPGWHGMIDDIYWDDLFDAPPPQLPIGLYRWSGYHIGSWDEGDPIQISEGSFLSLASHAQRTPLRHDFLPALRRAESWAIDAAIEALRPAHA